MLGIVLTLFHLDSLVRSSAWNGKKCPTIISKTIVGMPLQLGTIVIAYIGSLVVESDGNLSRCLVPNNETI